MSKARPATPGNGALAAEEVSSADTSPGPDSIATNAFSYFGVQVISYSFTAFLTLFLVRALNPAGYGLLGLATAIGAVLSLPSDFGVSQSAARFIAENRADRATVGQILSSALRLRLALGGIVGVSLFVASEPLASAYGKPGLTWVIRAISIVILGQAVMSLLTYALVALGRTALNLRIVLAQSVVETGATVTLVLVGAGAAGAAFGRAASFLIGAAVAVAVMIRLLGRRSISLRSDRDIWRGRLVRYGGVLVIVDSAYALFGQIDVMLVGAFRAGTAVGLYSAPLRLLPLLQLPAVAVSAGVSPRMVQDRGGPATDAFVRALRYVGILQASLVAPLLVWAGPIVHILFGRDYAGSAAVLRALTPFAFLLGFGTMLSLTANYLGQARRRIVVAVVTTIINLVACVILIPRIGIVGGAVGTDLAYAFYAPAHFWICKKTLDFSVLPIVGTLLRALAASSVMALVLLAFGTEPTALGLVVGSVVGVLSFIGALVVGGAVSSSEIKIAAAAASRVLARRVNA